MSGMNPSDFSDRVAVVSGASAGIGQALARDLLRAGARVVVSARRREPLEALREEFGSSRVAVVAGDASLRSTALTMLETAETQFKEPPDAVIVNAGRGLRGSVSDSDTTQWEEMVRVNLLGAAHLMREAAHRMVAMVESPGGVLDEAWQRKPRDIVVLGSTVGRHISPFSSMYGSTKFAVNSLAEALRREIAPKGVRVTLIEPGIVRTEFQESAGYEMEGFGAFMDRVGPVLKAEDVSRTIMFCLAQPASVHVNDVVIRPTRQEYP
ncbi:MAG: SDR family oxidoreductase [Phycisphaerales bacterium]|jgi:NADP-dependent 3-hydroxy acid dehydrogenase YdfG|nr:SDR family oxidoreductase [Phycisphaerales bacterium]